MSLSREEACATRNQQAVQHIRGAVSEALAKARAHYDLANLPAPEIDFSLRGKVAGQAGWRVRTRGGKKYASDLRLRFNLEAYRLNPAEMLDDTVPHEVAHLVVTVHFGPGCKPHGAQWQAVMRECFGLHPRRTHGLALTAARRVDRRFVYACKCSRHQLTSIRHGRMVRGQARYVCTNCGEILALQEPSL